MTVIFFWIALAPVFHTYIIFPALVLSRGLLWRRPYKSAEIMLRLSLIIAAYNEESSIRAYSDNIVSLDYPLNQLEVITASDGSNDDTDGTDN